MVVFQRYSWWVGAMVALAFFLAVFSAAGALSPFQGLFLTLTSPFEKVLTGAVSPFANGLSGLGDSSQLQNDNDRLRVENEQLRNQVAGLLPNADRVKELEAILNITRDAAGQTRLPASVVHRDLSPFSDVISIDRGSDDGVKQGMVVLSAQGTLIGTVTKVLGGSSFVRLLTDSRSKVAAESLETKSDGIVKGSVSRQLAFALVTGDIKIGESVVTSGLGGNYPPGIPIGRVTGVQGTAQDVFRSVTIEPNVRLSTARTVLVLTSFLPQRIRVDP